MTLMDRRAFLARGAAGVLTVSALERLARRDAAARPFGPSSYGPPERTPDQRGRFILAVPAGFSYVTFGDIGHPMSDGNVTPLALDGMNAFPGPDGTVRLVRNHEDRNPAGAGSVGGDPAAKYDAAGGGGTSTLDYDPVSRTLVRDFISLNGTTVNCAGGYGLGHRSWLTGEESIRGPEHLTPAQQFPKRHGYLFEVPVDRDMGELTAAEPLRAMGRFAHEAAATDQETGVVYETEDAAGGRGSGFYRFIPDDVNDLAAGGRLQMLAIKDRPNYDAREGQRPGKPLPIDWVDIDDPDPPYANDDDPRRTFEQGWRRGGTKFNRLEGCWYDAGSIYFVSTSGGDVKNGDMNPDGYREGFGQVWEYRPRASAGGQLVLAYESPGAESLDSPDNLTVTPRGGLMLCEDDASGAHVDTHPTAPGIRQVNRVIGVNRDGEAFEFAVNTYSGSELAGVCFSPDGQTVFVNVFGDSSGTPAQHFEKGMTCAITGRWGDGPL